MLLKEKRWWEEMDKKYTTAITWINISFYVHVDLKAEWLCELVRKLILSFL